MSDPELTVRRLGDDDFEVASAVVSSAFFDDDTDEERAVHRLLFDSGVFHGVHDGEGMIGSGGMLARALTLPGGAREPVGAVTAVGVAPGHRRRGALGSLMRTQFSHLHEQGNESVAILWASEGGIYGRYGYAPAAQGCDLRIPADAPFRLGVDTGRQRVSELERDAALPRLREIYERAAALRNGWLSRTEASWADVLSDHEQARKGASKLRFALHPDGYAAYRVKGDWTRRGPDVELRIVDMAAANPAAHAALWRYLLDMDLVSEVRYRLAAVDDPVTYLLANPAQAIRDHGDSLWVRLVDVDRALAARRYLAPLDLVIEVTDAVCPWNAGRWRIVADDDGRAEVKSTEDEPSLAMDIADLAAAYLGGVRLTTLAAAGRVAELVPGALRRASTAFLAEQEPHSPEIF